MTHMTAMNCFKRGKIKDMRLLKSIKLVKTVFRQRRFCPVLTTQIIATLKRTVKIIKTAKTKIITNRLIINVLIKTHLKLATEDLSNHLSN